MLKLKILMFEDKLLVVVLTDTVISTVNALTLELNSVELCENIQICVISLP